MSANILVMPVDGHVFVCEIDGRLRSMPWETANPSSFTHCMENFPDASVTRELLHYSSDSSGEAQQLFLPTSETLTKRIMSTWYQHGLRPAMELIVAERGGYTGSLIQYMLLVLDKVSAPKTTNFIHYNDEVSLIRSLAWHPHIQAIAVTAWDDSIRLFSNEDESLSNCILKTKMQRSVSCLAWRPYTASTLAVGCEEGVVIWNRDPNNKTSMVCVTFLSLPNRSPVTCLDWDTQGRVLLTASSSNRDLYVWNTEMEKSLRLPRRGGEEVGLEVLWSPSKLRRLLASGGTVFVLWSPSKLHLFTASTSTAFHVWSCQDWSCEKWFVRRGHVMSACFSACGSVLLFTSSEEPLVYAISMKPALNTIAGSPQQEAHLVLDHTLTETENGTKWGGLIKSMVWDQQCRYLAIISRESDMVTVFTTQLGVSLNIESCCAITGKPEEKPSYICFQPNFEDGSLLTIAWSSGRVQYFPFIYSDTLEHPVPLQDVAPIMKRLSSPLPPAAVPKVKSPPYSPSVFQTSSLSPRPPIQSPYNQHYSPPYYQQQTSSPLMPQQSPAFSPNWSISPPTPRHSLNRSGFNSPLLTSIHQPGQELSYRARSPTQMAPQNPKKCYYFYFD